MGSDKILYKSMKSLLNQDLTQAEAESLYDEGLNIKNPKRKDAVMFSLYKKAVSGDLSAIKELHTILSQGIDEKGTNGKAVTIVDDIGD